MKSLHHGKYQSLILAMILLVAAVPASMAANNPLDLLTAPLQKAYAVSGNLDASTCAGTGVTWDGGTNTCTVTGTLEVGSTETLTIPFRTVLLVESGGIINAFESAIIVSNGGTIDNRGIINKNFNIVDNHGTIDNFGTINNSGFGSIRNYSDGTININPGGIINNPNNEIYNNGTINNAGTIDNLGRIYNFGIIYDNCGTFIGIIPTSGNAIVDNCGDHHQQQFGLSIESVDLSGNPITGMWTVIRSAANNTIVGTGFTPLAFTGNADTEYKVSVANYDGRMFHHWGDNSTDRTYAINLTANATIAAHYDTGDSFRGFTSLTYTGTEEQPDLTVNALTVGGNKTLHMWTIIDPQSTDASGTTYKLYASNYKDRVFDRWSDGSTDRVRSVTIGESATVTAYYQAG